MALSAILATKRSIPRLNQLLPHSADKGKVSDLYVSHIHTASKNTSSREHSDRQTIRPYGIIDGFVTTVWQYCVTVFVSQCVDLVHQRFDIKASDFSLKTRFASCSAFTSGGVRGFHTVNVALLA